MRNLDLESEMANMLVRVRYDENDEWECDRYEVWDTKEDRPGTDTTAVRACRGGALASEACSRGSTLGLRQSPVYLYLSRRFSLSLGNAHLACVNIDLLELEGG